MYVVFYNVDFHEVDDSSPKAVQWRRFDPELVRQQYLGMHVGTCEWDAG